MDIVQTFYDSLASKYDKLFSDWHAAIKEQASVMDCILKDNGISAPCEILDCACGIGTQAIGMASLGYRVTGSDISSKELEEAQKRAKDMGAELSLYRADFRNLSDVFAVAFPVVMAMDNALPHMLTKEDLEKAVKSMVGQLMPGGLFIASIRDYDLLLKDKPPYSPPYIHKTEKGHRVSFQTWHWSEDSYRLVQYIIEDEEKIETHKFECMYRAVRRDELTELLLSSGCESVAWKFPKETGFYQPIMVAKKKKERKVDGVS